MQEKDLNLNDISPKFQGILSRLFKSDEQNYLSSALKFSLSKGGAKELGFVREEGVSHNPRPARVSQILIEDARCAEPSSVVAAMLATIDWSKSNVSEALKIFTTREVVIAAQANSICESPFPLDPKTKQANLVAMSLWVDRVRHFHQTPDEYQEEHKLFVITKNEHFINSADSIAPLIKDRLTSWKNIYCRRAI